MSQLKKYSLAAGERSHAVKVEAIFLVKECLVKNKRRELTGAGIRTGPARGLAISAAILHFYRLLPPFFPSWAAADERVFFFRVPLGHLLTSNIPSCVFLTVADPTPVSTAKIILMLCSITDALV